MKITAIKAQVKTENRVSIFLDGKYSFSLTLDQLLAEKLKKGDEFDENQLKIYKKLSDDGKLKQRSLEWLMGRPHSTREFSDYLFRKKADKELINVLIDEFTEKKYLDDRVFAKWFAENRIRKNKSTRAISSELYSKGISLAVIQNVLSDLEEENEGVTFEKQSLQKLIIKLKDRPRYQDEQKLIAYLIGKGFNYSEIKSELSRK